MTMDLVTIFLISLGAVLVFQSLVFLISLYLKRNDIADVVWSLGFLVILNTWFFLLEEPSLGFKLVYLLITIWGVRLSLHIGNRFFSKDKEDPRYAGWRESWKFFTLRSFFQVFVLQGVLMVLVMSSVLVSLSEHSPYTSLGLLLGVLLWLLGFVYEVVGDWQLGQFIKDPSRYSLERGDLMTKGLWSTTRHPNYFGEMSMWWGIYLIAAPALPLPLMLLALVGPLTITLLLCFVSGVPMTERLWSERYGEKFELYKSSVPALIPNPFKVIMKR